MQAIGSLLLIFVVLYLLMKFWWVFAIIVFAIIAGVLVHFNNLKKQKELDYLNYLRLPAKERMAIDEAKRKELLVRQQKEEDDRVYWEQHRAELAVIEALHRFQQPQVVERVVVKESTKNSGISAGDWGRFGFLGAMAGYKKDEEIGVLHQQLHQSEQQTRTLQEILKKQK